MNKSPARSVASMTKQMFVLAAIAGALLGVVAVLWMFWSTVSAILSDFSANSADGSFLGAALFWGAMVGSLMGLLCGAGIYVAVEILAMRDPEASATKQSFTAGIGALIGGGLPGLSLVALALSTETPGTMMLLPLGFLTLCFVTAFLMLTGLNRCDSAEQAAL